MSLSVKPLDPEEVTVTLVEEEVLVKVHPVKVVLIG